MRRVAFGHDLPTAPPTRRGVGGPGGPLIDTTLGRRQRGGANDLIAQTSVPGITVGYVVPDGCSVALAAALANVEAGTPIAATDRMRLGSVGKTYVAAVVPASDVVDEEARAALVAAEPSPPLGGSHGLGVHIVDGGSLGPTLGHDGIMPGYSTALQYVPDHDVAIAVKLNTDAQPLLGPPPG